MSEISPIVRAIIVALAFIASFLTLYNAVKLKSGVLAMSSYAFGGGMLFLSTAFLLSIMPFGLTDSLHEAISFILLLLGFGLLCFGSFKIFKMSQV
ncbi:MAG: hypothetical protein Q7R43_04125 [Candidatus Daviesbacteria bacterium]|nr:hypothetical protein [Candidatus Daviesbacteria bacterium]